MAVTPGHFHVAAAHWRRRLDRCCLRPIQSNSLSRITVLNGPTLEEGSCDRVVDSS